MVLTFISQYEAYMKIITDSSHVKISPIPFIENKICRWRNEYWLPLYDRTLAGDCYKGYEISGSLTLY